MLMLSADTWGKILHADAPFSLRIACFASRVSCLVSLLSCLLSLVSRLLSLVSRLLSRVSCLVSRVACLVSLVRCLFALVSCLFAGQPSDCMRPQRDRTRQPLRLIGLQWDRMRPPLGSRLIASAVDAALAAARRKQAGWRQQRALKGLFAHAFFHTTESGFPQRIQCML